MAKVADFSIEEKLISLVRLQKIDSKLDQIQILKGELPMEVKDLEDEIEGLHARQVRVEEEINGINEFIEQKKDEIKEAQALIKKYEKQSDNVKNNRGILKNRPFVKGPVGKSMKMAGIRNLFKIKILGFLEFGVISFGL